MDLYFSSISWVKNEILKLLFWVLSYAFRIENWWFVFRGKGYYSTLLFLHIGHIYYPFLLICTGPDRFLPKSQITSWQLVIERSPSLNLKLNSIKHFNLSAWKIRRPREKKKYHHHFLRVDSKTIWLTLWTRVRLLLCCR